MLRTGLFTGANAEPVAAAIKWLESGVSFFGVGAPITPAETTAPGLKVVADEQK
jgi:hypothetical protein